LKGGKKPKGKEKQSDRYPCLEGMRREGGMFWVRRTETKTWGASQLIETKKDHEMRKERKRDD